MAPLSPSPPPLLSNFPFTVKSSLLLRFHSLRYCSTGIAACRFRRLSTASAPHQPTERVSAIVDDISRLSLPEVADLTEALHVRLGIQMLVMAILNPGMGEPASAFSGARAAVVPEDKEEEKTVFNLKLENFDAASKIKIIKEVRTFTDLGLKEAKELVEKAPTVLKTRCRRKTKQIGAKVVLG